LNTKDPGHVSSPRIQAIVSAAKRQRRMTRRVVVNCHSFQVSQFSDHFLLETTMSKRRSLHAWSLLLLFLLLARSGPDLAQVPGSATEPAKAAVGSALERALDQLAWRSIGPANMGGRVADVEGVPGDPNIVYVGSAAGGVWKTTNGGVTWQPIFERQGTISIGDIAVTPGNPDVIWVGTGESNVRNTVLFRRRRLQITGRRQDVATHGPE
jgi:hypothetical protein